MQPFAEPWQLEIRRSRAAVARFNDLLAQMHPVQARCVDRLLANVARERTGEELLPANHDYYEPWWKDE